MPTEYQATENAIADLVAAWYRENGPGDCLDFTASMARPLVRLIIPMVQSGTVRIEKEISEKR